MNKKDVVFRHSALRPYYVKNGMAESEKKKDGASEKTWNHMEFDFRVTMQKFKEEAKRKRQRLQDSVLVASLDKPSDACSIPHCNIPCERGKKHGPKRTRDHTIVFAITS